MVAVVVVIVDVDDEEGEGGGEDVCFPHSYGPVIASTLPLRKLMLRVDDLCRFYA